MKSKKQRKFYKNNTIKMKKGGNDFSINIFTFCYNEKAMLPHMVEFYRSKFNNPTITIYDNESTNNSKAIAIKLGCISKTFSSNNRQNEDKLKDLRNNCWKDVKNGWVIVCDMDELLNITETELMEENKKGTTIISTEGYNMIGNSKSILLDNIKINNIKKGVYDNYYSKYICFKVPDIKEIGFTHGSHTLENPVGNIKYSDKKYILKHISMPGLKFFKNKYKKRFQRTAEERLRQFNTHYTDNNENLKNRYNKALENAINIA